MTMTTSDIVTAGIKPSINFPRRRTKDDMTARFLFWPTNLPSGEREREREREREGGREGERERGREGEGGGRRVISRGKNGLQFPPDPLFPPSALRPTFGPPILKSGQSPAL